ncbi:MAG: hypothetical protein ACOX2F_02645 [bacterium]
MRSLISFIATFLVVVMVIFAASCSSDKKNVEKERVVPKKAMNIPYSPLIKAPKVKVRVITAAEVKERIEKKVENALAVPLEKMSLSKIEEIWDYYNKEVRFISTLEDRNSVNLENIEKRISKKALDYAHLVLLRQAFGDRTLLYLNRLEKIIIRCRKCREEIETIREWKRFYSVCIVGKRCSKEATFKIEVINGKKDIPWYRVDKKLFDSDKFEVRVEARDENNRFKILKYFELKKRGVIIDKLSSVRIKKDYKLNATILKTNSKSVEHLNFFNIELMPDYCSDSPTGKVRSIRHKFNEEEYIEVKVKVKSVVGERCPWNV